MSRNPQYSVASSAELKKFSWGFTSLVDRLQNTICSPRTDIQQLSEGLTQLQSLHHIMTVKFMSQVSISWQVFFCWIFFSSSRYAFLTRNIIASEDQKTAYQELHSIDLQERSGSLRSTQILCKHLIISQIQLELNTTEDQCQFRYHQNVIVFLPLSEWQDHL